MIPLMEPAVVLDCASISRQHPARAARGTSLQREVHLLCFSQVSGPVRTGSTSEKQRQDRQASYRPALRMDNA